MQFATHSFKADSDICGPAVANDVSQRLLHNSIHVGGGCLAQAQGLIKVSAKLNTHPVTLTGARRERLESRRKTPSLTAHGRQAARERTGALDGVVDEPDDFLHFKA